MPQNPLKDNDRYGKPNAPSIVSRNPLSDLVKQYTSGGVKAGLKETSNLPAELAAKRGMMDEARKALMPPTPAPASKPMPSPEPVTMKDKVSPGGAPYGSKPPERRIPSSELGEMTKRLPTQVQSFKKGGKVPETGVYQLHKDEKVVTPTQHEKMQKHVMGLAESVLGHEEGPEPPMPPKVDRKMHIKKLADNSFHITHEHDHPEVHKDEEYSAKNLTELKKHMDDHFGKGEMKETPEEESKESPAIEQMEQSLGYEK